MWHRPRHLHSLLTRYLHGGKWVVWTGTHPGIGLFNGTSAPLLALLHRIGGIPRACPFAWTTSTTGGLSPWAYPKACVSCRACYRLRLIGGLIIAVWGVVVIVLVVLAILVLLGITRGILGRGGTLMGPA